MKHSYTRSLNSQRNDLNGHVRFLNGQPATLNGHARFLNSQPATLNSHARFLNGHMHSLNSHARSLHSQRDVLSDENVSVNMQKAYRTFPAGFNEFYSIWRARKLAAVWQSFISTSVTESLSVNMMILPTGSPLEMIG